MTSRTFIAVDPGGSGAVAWSDRSGCYVESMPDTRRGCIELFKRVTKPLIINPVAYIEKVASYIPGGGQSAMFVYGRNVERAGCILETLNIPIIEISPKSWQRALGLGSSNRIPIPKAPKGYGKDQTKLWEHTNTDRIKSAKDHNDRAKREWKAKLKAEAERRYPDIRVTLKTCDALLILEAAILLEGYKLL